MGTHRDVFGRLCRCFWPVSKISTQHNCRRRSSLRRTRVQIAGGVALSLTLVAGQPNCFAAPVASSWRETLGSASFSDYAKLVATRLPAARDRRDKASTAATLAAHGFSGVFSTQAEFDKPDASRLLSVCSDLSLYFSPDQKGSLLPLIEKRFAVEAGIAKLNADDMEKLGWVLKNIGAGDALRARVAAGWIKTHPALNDCLPKHILSLTFSIGRATDATAAQQAIVEYAWTKYLNDDAAWGSAKSADTVNLASRISPLLSSERKATLLLRLDQFAANKIVMKDLDARGLDHLVWAFKGAGSTHAARAKVAVDWYRAEKDRRLRSSEIVSMLYALERAPEMKELYEKLVGDAWTQYLSRELPRDAGLTRSGLLDLSAKAALLLSQDQKQKLQEGLAKSYLYDPNVLPTLSGSEMRALVTAVNGLEMTDFEIGNSVVQWVKSSHEWKLATPSDFQSLIGQLKRGSAPGAEDTGAQFCTALYDHSLSDPAYLRAVGSKEVSDVIRIVGISLSAQQRQQWERLYYDFVLKGGAGEGHVPSLLEITTVGKIIHNADLDQQGTVYKEYGPAAAAALRRGDVLGDHYFDHKFVAIGFCSTPMRELLLAEVQDKAGHVRLDVTKVLAFAYQRAGQIKDWQRYIDDMLKTASIKGDTKAAWLLAMAYTQEIETAEWGPLNGREIIEEAMAASQSEAMRLECANWMLWRFVEAREYDQARAYLKEVSTRLASAESKEKLAEQAQTIEYKARYGAQKQTRTTQGWESQQLRRRLEQLQGTLAQVKQQDGNARLLEQAVHAIQTRLAAGVAQK
jgi:hypothetical protein